MRMRTATGSIWKLAGPLDWIVIPTNIGWRKDGTAVLGAGLAKQAAERWPGLALDYGEQCMLHGANTPVLAHRPRGYNSRSLLLFPTKPLDRNKPHLSWQKPADLDLIKRSLRELETLLPHLEGNREVYIPDVGCGRRTGQLPLEIIRPLIIAQFKDYERIVHVQSR